MFLHPHLVFLLEQVVRGYSVLPFRLPSATEVPVH